MTRVLFAAALTAAILPASMAHSSQAQERGGGAEQPQQAGGAALSKTDREFVDRAAIGGLFEVKLGQIAVQQAQDESVRKFGQRMIDDHSAANKKLSEIAQRRGFTTPQQLDKEHQEKVDRLSKKSGAGFDRDYMSEMVDDHERDVDQFEKASRDLKDPDLKTFATNTLPTLRAHLDSARQIRDTLKKNK